MKILYTGKIPAPETPWWINLDIKCQNCGTIFALDASDKPLYSAYRDIGFQQWIQIPCPICKKDVLHTIK